MELSTHPPSEGVEGVEGVDHPQRVLTTCHSYHWQLIIK